MPEFATLLDRLSNSASIERLGNAGCALYLCLDILPVASHVDDASLMVLRDSLDSSYPVSAQQLDIGGDQVGPVAWSGLDSFILGWRRG